MSDKSQTLERPVEFERISIFSKINFHMPPVPVLVLILIVGFLVLTPLALMILNSFQTARPGQPIVWGNLREVYHAVNIRAGRRLKKINCRVCTSPAAM